jgi:DNA-binding NtrC family response regulator
MRIRVLLVDDDRDMANLMSRLLTMDGYDVSIAGGVAEALHLVRATPFDVMLSDIQLPDGDGIQLISQVRQFSQMPAIIVSGHGDDETLRRTRAAGFCAHLVKPATVEDICATISRALNRPPM